MSTKQELQAAEAAAVEVPAVVLAFREWAADIEAGASDTAVLSILTQLAEATTAGDLSAPWETAGTEAILGQAIVITGLKRQPSDFAEGLGFYLVVTGYVVDGGAPVTFTTGSTSVVGQLVRAHHLDMLPIKCRLLRAERPTADGYYPQHLQVFGSPDAF